MSNYGYPRVRTPYTSAHHIRPATLDDGRIVGDFIRDDDGTVVLEKQVQARHQLQRPPAWAIDVAHLDELLDLDPEGIIRLHIHARETIEASAQDFLDYGFDIDRGYGAQVGLGLEYWSESAGEPKRPSQQPVMQAAASALQLDLALTASESGQTFHKRPRRRGTHVGPSPVYAAAMRATWGHEVQP